MYTCIVWVLQGNIVRLSSIAYCYNKETKTYYDDILMLLYYYIIILLLNSIKIILTMILNLIYIYKMYIINT